MRCFWWSGALSKIKTLFGMGNESIFGNTFVSRTSINTSASIWFTVVSYSRASNIPSAFNKAIAEQPCECLCCQIHAEMRGFNGQHTHIFFSLLPRYHEIHLRRRTDLLWMHRLQNLACSQSLLRVIPCSWHEQQTCSAVYWTLKNSEILPAISSYSK